LRAWRASQSLHVHQRIAFCHHFTAFENGLPTRPACSARILVPTFMVLQNDQQAALHG
jgi:hypothetical protein